MTSIEIDNLLKELRLPNLIEKRKAVKEAEKLTAMKFIETSPKRVEQKLLVIIKRPFVFKSRSRTSFVILGIACWGLAVFFGMIFACGQGHSPNRLDDGVMSIIMLGTGVGVFLGSREREVIEISVMPLTQWCNNIPYGGLLAVKEAKERGLSKFQIYYPNVKSDPIITGKDRYGTEYEVFAWDDGKVYEGIL